MISDGFDDDGGRESKVGLCDNENQSWLGGCGYCVDGG